MTLLRIVVVLGLVWVCGVSPLGAQPPLPTGWPARLELGLSDGPGGAAALRLTAPFAFRYQYLAGGVNTGYGWATWNANADFPRYYIEESIASGVMPVFTYYMVSRRPCLRPRKVRD